jgi:hypothetical protein
VRHGPRRVWFAPWKTRCACGCEWFPCPDLIKVNRRPVSWNEKTSVYPTTTSRFLPRNQRPLMTPGQEWRSRRSAR